MGITACAFPFKLKLEAGRTIIMARYDQRSAVWLAGALGAKVVQLHPFFLKQRQHQLTIHGDLLAGQELIVLPDGKATAMVGAEESLVRFCDRPSAMRASADAFLLRGKERFCAFDGLCGDFQFSQHGADILQEGIGAFFAAFDVLQTLFPFCGQKR